MMIKKRYSKNKVYCRVTFELPAGMNIEEASVCGDFNNWNPDANPMKRRKNGNWYVIITLSPNRQYRFRYFFDRKRWGNDTTADDHVSNSFGSNDSLIVI